MVEVIGVEPFDRGAGSMISWFTRSQAISAPPRGALGGSALQYPQLAVLYGEFEILRVPEQLFEGVADGLQLVTTPGWPRPGWDAPAAVPASDDVLALGVEEEVDESRFWPVAGFRVNPTLAPEVLRGCRTPWPGSLRRCRPGRTALRDGDTPGLVVPRSQDGLDRAEKLALWILREGAAGDRSMSP